MTLPSRAREREREKSSATALYSRATSITFRAESARRAEVRQQRQAKVSRCAALRERGGVVVVVAGGGRVKNGMETEKQRFGGWKEKKRRRRIRSLGSINKWSHFATRRYLRFVFTCLGGDTQVYIYMYNPRGSYQGPVLYRRVMES